MPDFQPVHPGEVLRVDFMEPLGMTPTGLAAALGIDPTALDEFLAGRRPITADMALRLSRYFGTSPEFWMGLQSTYDLEVARDTLKDRIDREVTPRAA